MYKSQLLCNPLTIYNILTISLNEKILLRDNHNFKIGVKV